MNSPHVSKRTSVKVTDEKVAFLIKSYGYDQLEEIFAKLAYEDKKRILDAAFKKAIIPLVNQARLFAPGGRTGNLKRSIGTLPLKGQMGIFAGARRGGTSGSDFAGWHGHLLNDGTVDRFYIAKKTGPIPGKNGGWRTVKAGSEVKTGKMSTGKSYFGWFTKAAEATEEQVINTIADEWYKSVTRFVIKKQLDK